MLTTVPNRVHQPLVFSIDDRLLEQHLTRVDLSSQHLQKLDKLSHDISFNIILLDYNDISKLEYLDNYPQLIQLSISHNRLVDIRLLGRIRPLQKLNLSFNLIDSIDCLRTLQNLVVLNISNNNIHSIGALNTCHSLQSLDASENSIQHIEDLSQLTSLKYLNLHKNFIDVLASIQRYWPKSLHTIVLSDNEIQDLTQISYLTSFIDLNTLYIADNPCLSVVDERHGCHQPFDYRPYILNWCLSIHNLDGAFITRKESLKAEWLLSQGKGRSFRPGEHHELIQYLTRVCGTDPDQKDEVHLSRIMLQLMKDTNETLSVTNGKPQERTPSPAFTRPSSVNTDYDNRPIKPLDQNMLQIKLNEYPVTTTIHSKASNNTQSAKRASPRLVYNANRYSPKVTRIGPTASSALRTTSNRNIIQQRHNRIKRQTTNLSNTNALRALNHSLEESIHSFKSKEKPTSKSTPNNSKNRKYDEEDEDVQLKSAPVNHMHLHRSITTMSNNVELQRLTESVETMRKSILQAYLDLHERFTKTTELQTSALAALWNEYETKNLNHQRQTEKLTKENQLLHQRIHELEIRLNMTDLKSNNSSPNPTMKQNPNLYPPLRAHISKRDTKSFYLHWIPNPLNEHHTILGYRIYVDDIFKGALDPGRFEAIIDYIRDEGEYKIKIRTYNEQGESADSNIVIARFRRQPEIETPTQSEEQISSNKTSPYHLKPPKSPSSSPGRAADKISPNHRSSCSKVLFDPTSNSEASTKRSPTRAGIMSRLAKSSYRLKKNQIVTTCSPTEPDIQAKPTKRILTFEPDRSSYDFEHVLAQNISIRSPNITRSMIFQHSSTPPRAENTTTKTFLDEQL